MRVNNKGNLIMLEVTIWQIRFFIKYVYISVVTYAGEPKSKRGDIRLYVKLTRITLISNTINNIGKCCDALPFLLVYKKIY